MLIQTLITSALLLGDVDAHATTGRRRYGLIGFGVKMYDPPCAFACRDMASGFMLDCGDAGSGGGSHHGGMEMEKPTPLCYTVNEPFLQTLAYCISTHCQDQPFSKLENWWVEEVAGREPNQPVPKISYQKALANVGQAPTSIVGEEDVLNRTSLIDEDGWLASYNGDHGFEITEIRSETYGLVVLLTCVIIPIVFSWLRFLPISPALVSKFYGYFIDPPVFGKYHAVPVLGLAIVPTRGQALFIAYIWAINIILSGVGYYITDPNSWYTSKGEQVAAFVSNRLGVLSFANLVLTVLYSSRNNILLYITNWSHSTFLLVHRWVAFLCTLQACIHSAMWLRLYINMGKESYEMEIKLEYWVWGIIATLALSILIPLSALPIRKKAYEVFLATHVVFAVLAMIGCFLHIYYRFSWQWGYENWVWITFAVWIFDRFLARPLRIARHGLKRAHVTVVDTDYLRVDIPGVEAAGQAYLYFPTLTWRVWENHPFSVAAVSGQRVSRPASTSGKSDPPSEELDKEGNAISSRNLSQTTTRESGITFYVRRRGGLTLQLERVASSGAGILVLVEGSYGPEQSINHSPAVKPSLKYPNIILIAGGVGITAVLPVLNKANSLVGPLGTAKLFWGVRTEPLVHSVEELLNQQGGRVGGKSVWGNIDVTVSIGERFNLRQLLETELAGVHGGTTVVVCGPPGMADDARIAVTALARHGAVVRFSEESFSW